jgi:hypothetical protein
MSNLYLLLPLFFITISASSRSAYSCFLTLSSSCWNSICDYSRQEIFVPCRKYQDKWALQCENFPFSLSSLLLSSLPLLLCVLCLSSVLRYYEKFLILKSQSCQKLVSRNTSYTTQPNLQLRFKEREHRDVSSPKYIKYVQKWRKGRVLLNSEYKYRRCPLCLLDNFM